MCFGGCLTDILILFLFLRADFTAEFSPFYGIEKSAVLQEARVFNDRELDARRCAQVRIE